MTPAEANLHAIAESFCAPRVVRYGCGTCQGRGLVRYHGGTGSRETYETCRTCAGRGYIVTEEEPAP